MIRNYVTFRCPIVFVPVSEDEGILAVAGTAWFLSLLKRVDGLAVRDDICQEDWGVVFFAKRAQLRFWIGLSAWPSDEGMWLAHFHHDSFAWRQRWSAAGQSELERLTYDIQSVLEGNPAISNAIWHSKHELR